MEYMKYVIIAVLALVAVVYGIVLFYDLYRHRAEIKGEQGSTKLISIVSPIILFISSMGVSDMTMNSFFFNKCDLVDGKRLPGTLITCASLPLSIVALIFVANSSVDVTLVAMCMVLQTVGALIGVKLVSGMDGSAIKKYLGYVLLATAVVLIIKLIVESVSGDSNTETSFPLVKTIILGVFAFGFGVVNMLGMPTKAPYMALLLIMGMRADCILPIVMSACTCSSLMGSIEYVKKGIYQKKIALIYSTVGFIGVGLGSLCALQLPAIVLTVIMVLLTVYTGISLLRKKKK